MIRRKDLSYPVSNPSGMENWDSNIDPEELWLHYNVKDKQTHIIWYTKRSDKKIEDEVKSGREHR